MRSAARWLTWRRPGGSALRRALAIQRPDTDSETFSFPRERPGLDYALNWSLNADGVTPGGDAYRLTKASQAERLLGGKAAPVTESATAADEVDDEAVFDAALEQTINSLEAARALYVAEGDAPQTRVPCRVITDDLRLAATTISQVVEQMPLREPTELKVTCFVATSGPDFAALDFFDEEGEERVKIVLSGADANAAKLKASISIAVEKLQEPIEASEA